MSGSSKYRMGEHELTLFDILRSLRMSLFSNFVLLGDFNVDVLSNSYLCNHLNYNILYNFHLTR